MSTEPVKILLVEDDEPVRETLAMLLEEKGYHMQEAANGKVAWDIIPQFKPDVILTDLKMPEMNGIELLESVSKEKIEIPVIIFSGQGTADDTIRALQLGAHGYIEKPLKDVNFITHAIDKACEKKELMSLAKNYQQLFEESLEERTVELNKKIKLLKAAEERILRTKREWENTVDSINEVVALYDKDHRLLRYNKSFLDLQGMGGEEPFNNRSCIFGYDCMSDENCPHHQVLQSGQEQSVIHNHEGSGKTLEAQVLPYKVDGNVQGTILIARDITDITAAEEEQERLQTRLLQAQKLESVGQLASGIAHEINTPTQYVSSNLDFLSDACQEIKEILTTISGVIKGKEDPVSKEIYQILEDADLEYLTEEVPVAIKQSSEGADRIRSIVLAMKEFSHPGSKHKEPANLNKIIETTITVARNEWKYVSEVTTDLAADLPHTECLTDEIGQVVLNLLVNAAQAISEKLGDNPTDKKGAIHISTSFNDKDIEMILTDNGPGIPQDIIDKIFDPFFTTKDVGKGTGQGLAIAHDVISKKHDGTMEVSSEVGKGARFRITLPILVSKG